jgi:hypothetical protein
VRHAGQLLRGVRLADSGTYGELSDSDWVRHTGALVERIVVIAVFTRDGVVVSLLLLAVR